MSNSKYRKESVGKGVNRRVFTVSIHFFSGYFEINFNSSQVVSFHLKSFQLISSQF